MHRRYAALPLLLTLCACGGGPAAPELTAALQPAGGDGPGRLVQVVLTAGGAPVRVASLQLRGGGFAQVPPAPRDDDVPAGAGVALPLEDGPVLCQGRAAPTVLLVGTPGGVREVEVTSQDLLAGLRAAECAAAR